MKTVSTNYTIQDFIAALDRKEIIVNRDYQPSDEVWPDAARSYLIETILLDFPIPKLALQQVTDAATGKSYKELVDGQQRAATIRAFHADSLRCRRPSRTRRSAEFSTRASTSISGRRSSTTS